MKTSHALETYDAAHSVVSTFPCSGISSSDQQSLIQQPKSILKAPGTSGRYTEQRSIAESSASGVSQVTIMVIITQDHTSSPNNLKYCQLSPQMCDPSLLTPQPAIERLLASAGC